MVSGVQYDEPVVEQRGTPTNLHTVASTGGVGSVVDVFGKVVTGLVGGRYRVLRNVGWGF